MKHTEQAAAYATSRVGERGERAMPNEYEWDAIATAFTAGQVAQWTKPGDRLPPYGVEVLALFRGNDHVTRAYVCKPTADDTRLVAWMPIPNH